LSVLFGDSIHLMAFLQIRVFLFTLLVWLMLHIIVIHAVFRLSTSGPVHA